MASGGGKDPPAAENGYQKLRDKYEEFDPVQHGLDASFRLTSFTKLKG